MLIIQNGLIDVNGKALFNNAQFAKLIKLWTEQWGGGEQLISAVVYCKCSILG